MILFIPRIRTRDDDLTGRLFVVPTGFDGREFSRLFIVDLAAVQMAQKELNRYQEGRQERPFGNDIPSKAYVPRNLCQAPVAATQNAPAR